MAQFLPFDSKARSRARDRAASLIEGRTEMLEHVQEELEARAAFAGDVPEGPELRIGLMLPLAGPEGDRVGQDPSPALALARGGVCGLEDDRRYADHSFARISAFMTLHGVNDLPGALVLMRRALKPGGRLQAVFPAGMCLPEVREAFLSADASGSGGVPPRVGPTVDPAEAAGLLQRAGFSDPVAEVDTLRLRYRSLADVARDVRAHGDSGWLATRARGLTTPRRWALAESLFAANADPDGKIGVTVQLLYLSARA